jgi:ATP-dependent protease Clp ATPase subunit
MGEQPQPEREIELCTPDIIDLPIVKLQDAGRPFKIKVSTIHMMIAGALEHFNEYIRARFLEWHIGLLKRRMEKMEIENEAQDLKAAEARSTCEKCEEHDHVRDQRGRRH